jgi:hypothetical protein
MKEPREFQDFCRRFHQDAFSVSPSMPEAIGAALKSFDDQQKKVLHDFILGLIDNDEPSINAGTELKRLWQKNNSDHWIRRRKRGEEVLSRSLESTANSEFVGRIEQKA